MSSGANLPLSQNILEGGREAGREIPQGVDLTRTEGVGTGAGVKGQARSCRALLIGELVLKIPPKDGCPGVALAA